MTLQSNSFSPWLYFFILPVVIAPVLGGFALYWIGYGMCSLTTKYYQRIEFYAVTLGIIAVSLWILRLTDWFLINWEEVYHFFFFYIGKMFEFIKFPTDLSFNLAHLIVKSSYYSPLAALGWGCLYRYKDKNNGPPEMGSPLKIAKKKFDKFRRSDKGWLVGFKKEDT